MESGEKMSGVEEKYFLDARNAVRLAKCKESNKPIGMLVWSLKFECLAADLNFF